MNIGEMIDNLYGLRARRLNQEKEVEDLKTQENFAKAAIIEQLQMGSLVGAKGQVATAAITFKVRPQVTDWDEVYGFIRENNMPTLLHKRITAGLWEQLLDDGVEVPGIESATTVDLSLTKASR